MDIWASLVSYFDWFYFPDVKWSDILEIVIISYIFYHILVWFKSSRAWTVLKGMLVLVGFIGVAAILQLNTILWIAKNTINVGIIALIILFQPELRKALEALGRKQIFRDIIKFDDRKDGEERLSDKTIYELVKTAIELGKAKTGALIVLEHDTPLGEYDATGIPVDAVVTTQLLVNIFEKNTPLHDGAVIIKNNRVTSATCYLPLTDRQDVNKELGTRHRAGLGISEVSDSLTIIVSEETGGISVAVNGSLYRDLDEDSLRKQLVSLKDEPQDTKKLFGIGAKSKKKGGHKDEE